MTQLSMPLFPSFEAQVVRRLHQQVTDHLADGITCPVCGQLCREYQRKLNANMVSVLVRMVRRYEQTARPIHFLDCWEKEQGRDYGYLQVWGLAIPHVSEDTQKRMSGLWTPTAMGIDFAHDRLRMARYAFIFNNKVSRFSSEMTGVVEALSDHFNFQELWNGAQE